MARRVIVIGAGLAGLLAAQRLAAAGIAVVVLDKGRAPGGRMCTRRDGEARWDHGAQFFTVRDPGFAAVVDVWRDAGVAVEWCRGFGATSDGHARLRGHPGMSAIGRHLASGLDVRTGLRVETIGTFEPGRDAARGASDPPPGALRWRVGLAPTGGPAAGEDLEADAIVLTPPVPQSLALLDAGRVALSPGDRAALDRIAYDPCIAVLAELDGPSALPPPGALDPGGEPIGWLADNLAKGVSPLPTATLHATPRFSAANFDRDREESARELLRAAAPLLGVRVRDHRVHAWRYARPAVLDDGPCRLAAGLPPLVFAGDAFVAPRVEGAAISGLAAADALLERMS